MAATAEIAPGSAGLAPWPRAPGQGMCWCPAVAQGRSGSRGAAGAGWGEPRKTSVTAPPWISGGFIGVVRSQEFFCYLYI